MPIVSLAGGGGGGVVVVAVVDMVGWIGGGWVSGLAGVCCVGWIYLMEGGSAIDVLMERKRDRYIRGR